MGSMGMQVLGTALCVIGWLGTILCCGLPMWKTTAYIGENIVVAQIIWDGLWMDCVVQSTGQMQCNSYESMLAMPQDIQAARAMVIISILLAMLGIFCTIVGGKCTNCVEDEATKAKIVIGAGVIFLLSSLMLLIPLCWTANTIIRDFYSPMVVDSRKREMGPSLYIGWASCGLLLIGGSLLCCNCPPRNEKPYSAKYTTARSVQNSNYV
ncbi:claudin-4-like [Hemicordylus capensis]|uniref:claudin-4-like n=1 Tax=Hemicordylus capensis TaxID=884348 RepID=UPI002303AFE4|nr:claudin-4-like [Hemicordylus capensis]